MGKGDKKTRRGKILRGSYGKTRPKHSASPPPEPKKKSTTKKKKAAKKK